MTSFEFRSPPRVVCGAGLSRNLGHMVAESIGSNIMIVTDEGLADAGVVGPVRDGLHAHGISTTVFSGVQADPSVAVVDAALNLGKEAQINGVIGLGGGSSMDVAKLTALLSRGGQEIGDVYGVNRAIGGRLPLMLIPTTAGTGSEATPVAIVTTATGEKHGVVTPLNLPDVAVLDPDLTLGLPAPVTAATGYDAISHAIEAFTSAADNNNPVSRSLARQSLQLIGANIRHACGEQRHPDARAGMMLGSYLAGLAFGNSPVAAAHALAYPLGSEFHLPHGVSIALVLPAVVDFNKTESMSAYSAIATDLFPLLASLTGAARVDQFVAHLQNLRADIGLPVRLRDAGISRDDLSMMAELAMDQTRLLVNNPRIVTRDDALSIYEAAW